MTTKNTIFEPYTVDLSYPKEKLAVQSSVFPDREYNFNELAQLHAGYQTPLERIQSQERAVFKSNTLTQVK